MSSRSTICLLVLCWLLLWAAPAASSSADGMVPLHPVAMADVQGASEDGHTSECHPFLHAPDTATMVFGQGLDRDPAHPAAIPAQSAWARARAGLTGASARTADQPRGSPPLYALTARLRL